MTVCQSVEPVQISIHAPREGCDVLIRFFENLVGKISIHAPREGCDPGVRDRRAAKRNFNPRTPRGVRRGQEYTFSVTADISIHAPREGCDHLSIIKNIIAPRFQSTHPARGATGGRAPHHKSKSFQSTHPARGATFECTLLFGFLVISIHAPREGCDVLDGVRGRGAPDFNPRTPRGVRPSNRPNQTYSERFQSTHPARGATGA